MDETRFVDEFFGLENPSEDALSFRKNDPQFK